MHQSSCCSASCDAGNKPDSRKIWTGLADGAVLGRVAESVPVVFDGILRRRLARLVGRHRGGGQLLLDQSELAMSTDGTIAHPSQPISRTLKVAGST